MPVDSPEIRNEAQIVNLDSRTKKFGDHQQNDVIPEPNSSWNVSLRHIFSLNNRRTEWTTRT